MQRLCPAAAFRGVALFASLTTIPSFADITPHGGMMRYPDVSATHIVFVYANDLWVVPREGGAAAPLAAPQGAEAFPRFSPDGKTIAFVGNYDGNRDLYTIPLGGGVPTRVTHHPSGETMCDWTPDGRIIFHFNGLSRLGRTNELFTVGPTGGLPEKLPVPYGTFGAISPDGAWLAYTPHSIDFRTWKRYRGGMQTDVWLFNLSDKSSKRITDWEGADSLPMWNGRTVYYLSDNGPEHRQNIWSYDTVSAARTQVTRFTDFDVKWPAIGPGPQGKGEIVFQLGPTLQLLDLATGESRTVNVTIPGDRRHLRARNVDASKFVAAFDLSSTGKRAVFEARGDIWTVPAEHGSPRNLTRTNGTAERMPAWSPDGRWIAYFSDATDEYELYIATTDGKGEPRQLTKDRGPFRMNPVWSPDSKHIAFEDKTGAIFVHTIDGETRKIDVDPYANTPRLSWSHDSNWIAYARSNPSRMASLCLYNLAEDKTHVVTRGMFNDTSPTFDRKGDFLYFLSNRDFSTPLYEDLGTTFVYANTTVALMVPLRKDVALPLPPTSDEESSEPKDKKDAASQPASSQAASASAPSSASAPAGEADGKPAETKPLVIDLDGFERRAVQLAIPKGNLGGLSVTHEGKLVYVRNPSTGADGKPALKLFDPNDDKRQEKTIVENVGNYAISADGKKLLVQSGDTYAVIDAAPDQKLEKPLALSGMSVEIDPRVEWRQLVRDAWRIMRDYFYDPGMHKLDWAKIYEQYSKMLDDAASREDVSFILAEMISELNVGHAYVWGQGDVESQPTVSVGMLGCDFVLDKTADGAAYRIARIHEGAPWDIDARGPLSRPGLKVGEGDYLLAVNRVPVNVAKDPWAAFQGMAGRTVILTVSAKPRLDEDAREIVVKLEGGEGNLRFRGWIESNRRYVEEKSGGKVGYIYVANTGVDGQNDLFRQFYGQLDKQALIIDERWNGGGQIPTRFIELLNRPVTNYWAARDGLDWQWPPDANPGPKCMLINGLAGSGGDCFPWYFRQAKLGKLIGTRTWGGLVGISGNPALIDGALVTAPTFAFYEKDGTWGVEGHGVDPDIEVIDDPAKMQNGADPQLDRAIDEMLSELRERPFVAPKRPAYPDRRGMGLPEADK